MACDQTSVFYVVPIWFGASVLWGLRGRQQLKVFFLCDILDLFMSGTGKKRQQVEYLIFVAAAVLIGYFIVSPVTGIQALAAGFGWTATLIPADAAPPAGTP